MGVNMAGNCISDDEACCEASKQEIIRRYFNALCAGARGENNSQEIFKLELLMNQSGIDSDYRKCTAVARKLESKTEQPCAAIELNNGEIITGKTTDLLGCSSAMLLNALKNLPALRTMFSLFRPMLSSLFRRSRLITLKVKIRVFIPTRC